MANNSEYEVKMLEDVYSNYEDERRSPEREEFRGLVDKAYSMLVEKAQNRETITHEELWERIDPAERKHYSYVLNGISRMEHSQDRPLLTVLAVDGERAVDRERGTPGKDFYKFLHNIGWLEDNDYIKPLSERDREEIAEEIKNAVYSQWSEQLS